MTKISYEQKVEVLERYKSRPIAVQDIAVLTAIKADVVRVHSGLAPAVKKAKDTQEGAVDGAERPENALYNQAMGVYRAFLTGRNSQLDMTGRKAKLNADAMRAILEYIRKFAKSNARPHADPDVLRGVQFLFNQDNWNRLNDFHRNRLKLPDIQHNIEEILPMIKNGYDKRTTGNAQIDNLESRLKAGRQQAGASEA